MRKHYTFYRLDTGELTPMQFCGEESLLEMNTPAGHGAIEGVHRYQSRRVGADGAIEAFQPPRPADTEWTAHRWDEHAEEWIAEPTLALKRRHASDRLLQSIRLAEAGQGRPAREIALAAAAGAPAPEAAVAALAAIDERIANLRARIAALAAAEADAIQEIVAGA